MGTWGVGAFENDGAADWADGLTPRKKPAVIEKALARVAKTRAGKPVDLDDAIEGLAAAEIVAASRGHVAKHVPDEALDWIEKVRFASSRGVVAAAIAAVGRVAAESELKAEWNGDKSWQREQQNLIARLRKPSRAMPKRKPALPPAEIIYGYEPPPVIPEVVAARKALAKLRMRLDIDGSGQATRLYPNGTPTVRDQDMPLIGSLTSLRWLQLGESRITDAGVAHLRNLKKLDCIELMETAVGDGAAEVLSKLPRLRDLHLAETRITDRALRAIGRMPRLEELHLNHTALSDAGLAQLARLPRLRGLHLEGTKVTGSAFVKFPESSPIVRLSLVDTRVGDAAMRHVARLRKLERLALEGTNVTNAGVAQLVNMKRLTMLDLESTRVSDAVIAHLAKMKSLKSIYVSRTRIKDLARMRKELPHVNIE